MILDSLTLNNFGAYRGVQTVMLSPEPGKPVILLGGMNGGGKTTLLDALQLAFYGPRARLSNRGKLAYKEYLRNCIHRGTKGQPSASISVAFRRQISGSQQSFELIRKWKESDKGLVEQVEVYRSGELDRRLTEQWDDFIDAYIPNGIAPLFFFDGEQIMALADRRKSAEILETAIHSLLGLELVERVETDLKVFERRNKAETLDDSASQELERIRAELESLEKKEAAVWDERGSLTDPIARAEQAIDAQQAKFAREGGSLFERRVNLERELEALKTQKQNLDEQLREQAAGALPLSLILPNLVAVEQQLAAEQAGQQAQLLNRALESRDQEVEERLKRQGIESKMLRVLRQTLEKDRETRRAAELEDAILDAPAELGAEIAKLREQRLPNVQLAVREQLTQVETLEDEILRVESDLARVPPVERIAQLQDALNDSRLRLQEMRGKHQQLSEEIELMARTKQSLESKLDQLGHRDVESYIMQDDRTRILDHSVRVRSTLNQFKTEVIKQHTGRLESLILESFQKLIRKANLVTALSIDPETFEVGLKDRNAEDLAFDRLSAGERQMLATSFLWGLARASGRPIPTIIDTPLGRLDSSHRGHLTKHYFPNAAHQVILLSTDEEVTGEHLKAIKPFVARSYLLEQDSRRGYTTVQDGYFAC